MSDDGEGEGEEEEEDADSVLVTDDDEYEDMASDEAGAEEDGHAPEESDLEKEDADQGRSAPQRQPVLRDELQVCTRDMSGLFCWKSLVACMPYKCVPRHSAHG